jgi:protein-disulfide isomerase/uncharacterized membrane protein
VLTVEKSARQLKVIILLALALSLGGFALSVVALQQHVLLTNNLSTGPSFCTLSDTINCDAVNASEWSSILGIPIASYGMFFYLVLIGGALSALIMRVFPPQAFAALALLLSVAANLGTLYLFPLSWFVIGALCLICIGLYVINFILLILLWRGVFPGRMKAALTEAVHLIGTFTRVVVRGGMSGSSWAARIIAVGLVLLAYWNVVAPEVLLAYYKEKRAHQNIVTHAAALQAWEAAPVVATGVRLDDGVFGDYWQGRHDAPIRIVEFADYGCGACRIMSGVLHELLARYEGKYLYVFRDYPLDSACNPSISQPFHQFSCLATYTARCAGEQGKFWEVNNFLFSAEELESEESIEKVQPALLERAARQIGLDPEALKECVASKRYLSAVHRDVQDGNALELQGTPSFWINDKKLSSFAPEVLEAVFERILKESDSNASAR